jgi:hypothetical protein
MKIGNPANYYVQTWPAWWDEPDQVAELLRDIVDVKLNMVVRVTFVPDFSAVPRPWIRSAEEPRTTEEARIEAALTAPIAVTPDDTRAGTTERIPTPSGERETVLLFVTAGEFASYRDELAVLTKSAATSNPTVRHDDIADLAVIRFLDERALEHVSPTAVAR